MSEEFRPAAAGFAAGSRIAGYLLEEQIGAGGMALVFRALDERLDRLVALKILASALAADEVFRQRFISESRAAAAVDDPHIIPVFEAGEASGVLFIAMRYVHGGDVRSLVAKSGHLPPGRAAELVSQVASALDAAHGRGLVHRDVKPANMLLDSGGGAGRPDHVYLSDFGLSKASLQASGLTGTGQVLGTLDYISPEQIEGKPVDGRADQYALACAAFELLAGAPPFRRQEAMAVMYAQLSEPPPRLTTRRPDLPLAVDQVFARALAKAPADRYANCREFADAMREALRIRPYDSVPGASSAASWQPTEVALPTAGMAAADGSPPTEAASQDYGATTPGLTEHRHEQADWPEDPVGGYDDGPARPRGRRSPGALVAAVLLAAVLGGGAYFALHGNGGSARGAGGLSAALAPPGCSESSAHGTSLASVPTKLVGIPGGNPFGARVSTDGTFVFAVTPTTVQVLAKGPGLELTPAYSYTITTPNMPAKGSNLTSDGKYLLVAVGNGIDVLSVPALESGAGYVTVGTLTTPNVTGYGGAVKVGLSVGDQFAFVTLQYRDEMAVFNLHQALTRGFSSADYVGAVPLAAQPMGISGSPDGKWLYVTSIAARKTGGISQGIVSVLSVAKLKATPASAVVSRAMAGCDPVRVIASADGKTVWVTARGSNYLLGFSADRLRTSPRHALIAKVKVGQGPTGMVLVGDGTKMVVANTDTSRISPTARNLAVVSLTAALGRKPALLGYIPSGMSPDEFALVPGARYLIVSDNGSAQLQVVDLRTLRSG